MLGELPKLFGRSFAVGFLLPAAAFGLALFGIAYIFGMSDGVLGLLKEKDVLGAAIALVLTWFWAVALMVLNRPIIRLLEGYGRINPFRPRVINKRVYFNRLNRQIENYKEKIAQAEAAGETPSLDLMLIYSDMHRQMAENFPDRRDLVLPTKLGNVIRAFESYPRFVYGLEGIHGWNRLIAVIPDGYMQRIEDAKSQMDFWINIWFGAVIVVIVYIVFAIWSGMLSGILVPFVAVIVAMIAIYEARLMAHGWGGLVMSAFDLFRGDLCERLGLSLPRSSQEEREMWQIVSEIFVFRSREAFDDLTIYKPLRPEDRKVE